MSGDLAPPENFLSLAAPRHAFFVGKRAGEVGRGGEDSDEQEADVNAADDTEEKDSKRVDCLPLPDDNDVSSSGPDGPKDGASSDKGPDELPDRLASLSYDDDDCQ